MGLLSESRNRTLDRGSDSYKRVKVQLCHLRDVREIVIKPIVQKYRKMPFWSWVDYCVSVYVSKLGADQAQRLVEVDQFYIQGRTAFPEGRLFPGSLVLPGMREKAREVAEVIAKFTGVSVLEHRIDEGASVRQPP